MSDFNAYKDRFQNASLTRSEGILTIAVHTGGGPLQWSKSAHREFEHLFAAVAGDEANEVVILTGTGDEFSGPDGLTAQKTSLLNGMNGLDLENLRQESVRMLTNLLRIPVPIIAAINGPALRHIEIPLMSDIVLAAEEACFQDTAHIAHGVAPGDGQHVILPLAMGLTRARYFLLTHQKLSAQEALEVGLVNEVVERDHLLDRATTLASELRSQPRLVRMMTRMILTRQLSREMADFLEIGLLLEGMGALGSNSG